MLVHARHKLEAFPSGLGEGFLRPHADLLDGFEAVADKRRADDQHALDALLGQARHLEVSVRLQPRITAQPGLECHGIIFWRHSGGLHEGLHGLEALRAIAGAVRRMAAGAAVVGRETVAAAWFGSSQRPLR